MSVALVSAATATATALTVGVEPPPDPAKRHAADAVDLAAAVQLLPDSGQFPANKALPDLTGGLGTTIYDFGQKFGDQIVRAIVNGISLTALAQAAGVDPQSLVTTLLADIPSNLVPDIVATIGLDLPILDTVLGQLTGGDAALLSQVLDLLGLDEAADGTITGLLALLGLSLEDPFNLSNLLTDDLGVNLITAGPTFSVLKMLGLDLGWVPGFPNSVADEINNTDYLKIGVNGLLNTVIGQLQEAIDNDTLDLLDLDALNGILGGLGLPIQLPGVDLTPVVQSLVGELGDILDGLTDGLPDVLHTRITPTVGIGLGAFAASMAYQQVINDLANQPGGSNYEELTGELNPLLGSLTILPLILLNNPARPDGGMFARFGPLAALFGIDTVNPRTELTGEGGLLGDTDLLGLHLGGANVLPVLVDATYEYQPLSDFAAWPNPFTLANNLAAALLPTYMLRGLTLDGLTDQLTPQLTDVLANTAAGNPLALNLYLTLESATLPVLEPLYLISDALNIVGLSPLAQIPMRIANALAPALGILTDVGYGNVVRNPDGTYTRDFSNMGDEVPFLSFPRLNPLQTIGDVFTALVGGIQKELGPNPTPSTPNALKTLLDAILGGDLGGLLGTGGGSGAGGGSGSGSGGGSSTGNPITDLLNNVLGGGGLGGLLGGLLGGGLLTQQSITAVPDTNARMVSLASATGEIQASAEKDSTTTDSTVTEQKASEAETDSGTADKAAAEQEAADKAAAEKEAADKAAAEKEAADTQDADTQDADTKDADTKDADKVGKGPKHAKAETGDDTGTSVKPRKAPKHAKADRDVVRDSANFSPKASAKNEAGGGDNDKTPAAADAADASEGAGADAGSAAA